MTRKIFLTSAIAMGIVANAYAEPSNTGEFPQNGLMQEDYTYTNAATETNMDGVYSGTVNATAQYENILYQLAAGQYLPANSETPTYCDQNGYYCAGDNNGVNYSNVAQGLTQCPSGYTNSDAGAQSSDQCYRSCSGNVTMQHATGVTGNDYYGNGTDTCAATGCDRGWHLSNGDFVGLNIDKSINYTKRYAKGDEQYTYGEYECSEGLSIYEDCSSNPEYAQLDVNEFVSIYPYGRIHGIASCSTTAPNNDALMTAYLLNGSKLQNGEITMEEFVAILLAAGTPEQDEIIMGLVTDYSNGVITENEVTERFIVEFSMDPRNDIDANTHGGHCWCKFNGYTPNGGTRQNISSQWVSMPGYNNQTYEQCMSFCVFDCAFDFGSQGSYIDFYDALMDSFGETLSVCEANRININWTGASAQAISANNAGVVNYGSDVRTPQSATPVPGKRFVGWRFSAPESASVESGD